MHLAKEGFRKAVEMGDLLVVLGGELVNGEKALVGVEAEMAGVVVGEIPGIASIADDEKLHEAQQRLGVAIAGVVLVVNDLLHGPARADAEGFQLDLHHRHAVDEQDDIVTLVAVVGVDAELVDDLEGVLAPVLDVDEGVVQRRAVIAGEAVALAEDCGGGEHVRRDDLVEQTLELAIGEVDAIQRLELLAEILFQRGAVTNVVTIGVFEIFKFCNQISFDEALCRRH